MFDFWADDARALTWTKDVLVKSESLAHFDRSTGSLSKRRAHARDAPWLVLSDSLQDRRTHSGL